jgi:hypothetical protein
MHALNRVSQVTNISIYNQWALELAKVASAAFTYVPSTGGAKRMVWKMSIDLSRPLVNSMGQHDPLDGLITYQQLETTAKCLPEMLSELSLKKEINEMVAMCVGRNWSTEDTLGIGGLLSDAYKLVQLIDIHNLHETARLEALLSNIEYSLRVFVTQNQLNVPAEYRLAFRELGLAIGLQTISRMQKCIQQKPEHFTNAKQLLALLNKLSYFNNIHELIENFWLEPDNQSIRTWKEHADINNVMLATSLAPDGYLQL